MSSSADRERLLAETARRAAAFLDEVGERPLAPAVDLATLRSTLGGELAEAGEDAAAVVARLDREMRPGLVGNVGPRFFGFVVGGVHPVALAADWLVATWDQNLGLHMLSPPESVAEEIAARWIVELLGLPREASVGFVTGGQLANFTGLAAARHHVLREVGWDVETQGLVGSPGIDVVASEESHITIHRALRYLGIGTDAVRPVRTDAEGRMQPEDLSAVLAGCTRPTVVCAQAGDVNSGCFDDFTEIVPRVREHGGWLHVDGAFGLWAAASGRHRHLTAGVAEADSWAVDAHKWLNVPQDCGVAIVRHSAAHRAAMSTNTAYLMKSAGGERDAVDWNPEFSRRARSLPVYAVLRHLGRRGVAELVDRCCDLCRRMADHLAASPHVERLNDVVLNQALVRFHRDPAAPDLAADDELTRAVLRRIQADGTCWLGGTQWKGVAAMRVSVINWSTDEAAIDRSAAAVLRCLQAELASPSSPS